jgi:hypothetical protein
MPLFLCTKCGCVENTACCHYWSRNIVAGAEIPPVCSVCDPAIGKWHSRFARTFPPANAVRPDRGNFIAYVMCEVCREFWNAPAHGADGGSFSHAFSPTPVEEPTS